MEKKIKLKKELLLLIVSLSLSLVVVEFGLRAFTVFPIHGKSKNRISHPVIKYTLDPALSDVDASGFRNPSDQGQHEILTIGDSHTYGSNVMRNDSWPYQLGRSLGKSVYNYGVGGYGIFHYLYLSKKAVRHKPEYVLLGLYPRNDIGPNVCRSVSPAYYQELLESGIANDECSRKRKKKNKKLRFREYLAISSAFEYLRIKYIRPLLARYLHSKYYFNIGGFMLRKWRVIVGNGMTDLSQKRVKSNFEASKTILSLISNELHDNGIKFGVVVIPSREIVVENWAIISGIEIPKKFSSKPEQNLIENYISFFREQDIPAIDATPYVVKAFVKSMDLKEDFYPNSSHPLAKGYESYSRAAAELISNMNH